MKELGRKDIIYSGIAGFISAILYIGMFIFPSAIFQEIFAFISPFPIAFIALFLGFNSGLISTIIGLILVAITIPNIALSYIIMDGLPILLISYLFICYKGKGITENNKNILTGEIITILSLVSGLLMILLYSFPYNNIAENIGITSTSVQDFFFQFFYTQVTKPSEIDEELWIGMIKQIVNYFPSAVSLLWIGRGIFCMILAQQILMIKGKSLKTTPKYSEIELPIWSIAPVILVMIFWILGGESLRYLLSNAFVLTIIPFIYVGILSVHRFLGKMRLAKVPLLILFYMILIFGSSYGMILVSLLGVLEFFINKKLIVRNDKKLRE